MNPLNLGSRRELFVDHLLIDRLDNAQLRLHELVSGGVAIESDKPWEGPGNNIIATDAGIPEFSFPCAPWLDTRPGVPANERIKVVRSEGAASGEKSTAMVDRLDHAKRLVFWASADGFTFRFMFERRAVCAS